VPNVRAADIKVVGRVLGVCVLDSILVRSNVGFIPVFSGVFFVTWRLSINSDSVARLGGGLRR
jgi:hypothetical protein